tara:strand:- start:102 stop:293 length:192 start_codon:yes stop_codon:yes gene_type:complete
MTHHDHSNILIKVLNNFYEKHNIPENERTCSEDFYFENNQAANDWLERYTRVWEKTVSKGFNK